MASLPRRGDAEPVCATQQARGGLGAFEAEHEVVVEVDGGGVEECVEEMVSVVVPGEVHVLRGAGAVGEA